MTKQYKVLKEMINVPVGTILKEYTFPNSDTQDGLYVGLEYSGISCVIDYKKIQIAQMQKFIEPYTPEPKHWRAEKWVRFWFVSEIGDVYSFTDKNDENEYYDLGNCFKSQATAELVAKAQKLFFEWLHDKEAGYCVDMINNFADAMDEAKQSVLEDDSNE